MSSTNDGPAVVEPYLDLAYLAVARQWQNLLAARGPDTDGTQQ